MNIFYLVQFSKSIGKTVAIGGNISENGTDILSGNLNVKKTTIRCPNSEYPVPKIV